jgi:acetyl esterase
MNTTIDPAENPQVEHNVRAFLKGVNASGNASSKTLSPGDARQALVQAQASVKLELPACEIENRTINQDGCDVSITIVRPAGGRDGRPVFMFFHGGGWVTGDFPTHERMVRDLVVDSGYTAVFVNYSRSPEAKYPTAINEAYAATKWVAQRGEEIKVDGKSLALIGNSVGGNMAAVVALMAKAKGGPAIKSQILFWPVTDASFDWESFKEFAEGYFLTAGTAKSVWTAYMTDPEARKQIYASPFRASIKELQGLPPAMVQTAGIDVLRDEGEAYARKLDAAGVEVIAVRYAGLIHDYGLLNALSDVPAVRAALHQAAEELKKRLN